jgi:hypothetical protein
MKHFTPEFALLSEVLNNGVKYKGIARYKSGSGNEFTARVRGIQSVTGGSGQR